MPVFPEVADARNEGEEGGEIDGDPAKDLRREGSPGEPRLGKGAHRLVRRHLGQEIGHGNDLPDHLVLAQPFRREHRALIRGGSEQVDRRCPHDRRLRLIREQLRQQRLGLADVMQDNAGGEAVRQRGEQTGVGDGANIYGFDCSGLTQYSFAGVGVLIPKYSGDQYNTGRKVPISQAKRGDLLFWGPGGGQHVAIYLGNNQMIEAPYTGATVRIAPVRTGGMTPFVVRYIEW